MYGHYPSYKQKEAKKEEAEQLTTDITTSKFKIISSGGKETIVTRNCRLFRMVNQEKEFASEIYVWHNDSSTWELAWSKRKGLILEPFWPGK